MGDLGKSNNKVYQFNDFSFYSSLEQPNNWGNRSHQEMQIILPQTNARAWITCPSSKTRPRQIKVGQSFLVAPYQEYNLDWQQKAKLTLFSFHPKFFANTLNDSLVDRHLEINEEFSLVDDALIFNIGNIFNHLCSSNLYLEELYVESLGNLLALHLLGKYLRFEAKNKNTQNRLSPQKLTLVLEYIEANLDSKITLFDLAEICNVCKFYFCRLFKNSTNTTPYKYILRQRIERAKLLLQSSNLSVSDISYECGFSSQSHLCKHFCRMLKTTPTRYRQKIRSQCNSFQHIVEK